jgi:hypothetical protein
MEELITALLPEADESVEHDQRIKVVCNRMALASFVLIFSYIFISIFFLPLIGIWM